MIFPSKTYRRISDTDEAFRLAYHSSVKEEDGIAEEDSSDDTALFAGLLKDIFDEISSG